MGRERKGDIYRFSIRVRNSQKYDFLKYSLTILLHCDLVWEYILF